ncbi:uncharacterized protein J3D65DRAFT_69039 [Phyllosticta citribraziliensis]|uniref:Uncharacterized protein n=1 Tax=Phyllosticta citribraziliensis TaxID=989973 RepID=A0ABR1LCW0_9PEZI
MEESQKIILSESSDWDAWLCAVKIRALQLGTWDLIDPAKESKPREIARPSPPECLQGDENSETHQKHLVKWQIYQIQMEQYQLQQRDLGSISDFILQRVSPYWLSRLMLLAKSHHPLEILRILHERMTPTHYERIHLSQSEPIKVDKMPKGPKESTVYEWLDAWDMIEARSRWSRDEIWRDFLAARLEMLDEKWYKENKSAVDKDWNTRELIDNYRRHWRDSRALDLCKYGYVRTTPEES